MKSFEIKSNDCPATSTYHDNGSLASIFVYLFFLDIFTHKRINFNRNKYVARQVLDLFHCLLMKFTEIFAWIDIEIELDRIQIANKFNYEKYIHVWIFWILLRQKMYEAMIKIFEKWNRFNFTFLWMWMKMDWDAAAFSSL